jgi:tetratricopeptide (TPR) repeat protein
MLSASGLCRKLHKCTLFVALLVCTFNTISAQTTAGDELNLGVEAYKSARYEEAIAHFQKAVNMDPGSVMAKTYLATALSQNVVPGLDTRENLKTAQQALDVFQQVLAAKPHDVNSMKQIAGVYFNIKKLDDAKEWQKKVLDEDSSDPEAAYTIGVIDWTEAHQNKLAALIPTGLTDDGMGNANAPAAVMGGLKEQNGALVEEALKYLALAVQLRPNYDDAMQYFNLVYRQKADLDWEDDAARNQDIAIAQDWARKAMATRKANEESQKNSDSPQP